MNPDTKSNFQFGRIERIVDQYLSTEDLSIPKIDILHNYGWLRILLMMLVFTNSSKEVISQTTSNVQEIIRSATHLGWTNPDSAILMLKNRFGSFSPGAGTLDMAHIAMSISRAYNTKGDCDSLAHWNKVAERIYQEKNDTRGMAEVYYQKGYDAYCRMDNEQAMEYVLQGLELMESLKDDSGIALGHLRLSRIFHFTLKAEQSAEYGRYAAARFEMLQDYSNASDAWGFAGHGYRMAHDTLQALECYENGMRMAKRSGLPNLEALAHKDLGWYYGDFGQFELAEKYLKIALENADPDEHLVIKNGLGLFYLRSGQYQKSIDILKGAIELAYKNDELFFLTEVPVSIAQSYAALSQYDSAYKYLELKVIYTDSIFSLNAEQAIEEMKAKYESDKKDQLITRQKIERQYGWALFGAMSLLAFMFYRRFVLKKRTNKILNIRNKEKDFLLKEIHHRVKNNLQILSSLLNIQADYIKDENALNAINEGRNRVQSMAFIHQQLYSENHLAAVNMKDYLADLCGHLSDTFSSDEKKINIDHDVQVEFLDVDTAIPLGLIVNELITNSIKYAFNFKDSGIIKVTLWLNESEQLCLFVQDDGAGMADGVDVSEKISFGTDMIKILSKKLKGKIELNTKGGYATKIIFDRFKVIEA